VTAPPPHGITPPPPVGGYPPPPPVGGYPPLPPFGGYPPPRQANSLAIVSLVCAFVFAPLGILFGHLSLSQIKKTGDEGRGMALAGLVISYVITLLAIVAVVFAAAFFYFFRNTIQAAFTHQDHSGFVDTDVPPHYYLLPVFAPPGVPGANCQYPATTEPASKPVRPPQTGKVSTDPAQIGASMATNLGHIGLTLDNKKSPCAVNNFASLARQGFYDNTTCHRLTTSKQLHLLQCGDPSGTGKGGPGYRFPSEYPTNQYRLSDPILKMPQMMYPRGTLATAHAGPGTNGSQFLLVYADTVLPATYTVFGQVDDAGLAVVDKVAGAGVAGGGVDGKPAQTLTIKSVHID
jgi:peptidyl-prolyl cis-trans isomerase B (cyclophilin B)